MGNIVCINKEDVCDVLRFYYILGRKWTYALLYSINSNKNYSFEDLFKVGKRRINRTMLSNIIKELIHLKILVKINKKYCLTAKGRKIKNILDKIKIIFIEDTKYIRQDIKEDCIVNSFLGDPKIN